MKNHKTHILLLFWLSFIAFVPIANAQFGTALSPRLTPTFLNSNLFGEESGEVSVTGVSLPTSGPGKTTYKHLYSLGSCEHSGLYGVALSPNWSVALFADTSGYISINNSLQPNGDATLTINGNMVSKSCVIENEGWADYVFDPGYKLTPLCDVESFIEKNGHLPEIPSQAEIAKKGLDVAPMLKLQMQKIEELTLYMIQQQKEMDGLDAKISELNTAALNARTHR